jgi:hypothetical protein
MKLFDRWKDAFNPRPCTWITKGTTYFNPWAMSTGNRVRYLISMVFSILLVATLMGAMVAGTNFILGSGIETIYPVGFDLIRVFWMSFGLGFLLIAVPFTVSQLRYWFSPKARVDAHTRYNFNMVHHMVDLGRQGIESSTIIESPSAAEKRANAADWSGEEVVDGEFEEVVDPNRTLH